MRENSPASEDIVVRRVQRRLERYFADLERPQISDGRKSSETAGTQIATVSTDSKHAPQLSVPKVTAPPPPPPPPLLVKEAFAPIKTVVTDERDLPKTSFPKPTSAPPILGKEGGSAKIAPLSEAPTSKTSTSETSTKKNSSFLPIFMFFLALVAALGILLGWYWFTGGGSQTLLP